MTTEIKVPVLPESVADATILEWHVKVGEQVAADESLVDLETDKVVLEVPAPADGVLKEIKQEVGAVVKTDELLAIFEAGAIASTPAEEKPAAEKSAEAPEAKPAASAAAPAVSQPSVSAAETSFSPSKRRDAAAQGLSPDQLSDRQEQNVAIGQAMGAREEKRVPMTRLRKRIAERLLNAKNSTAMLTTFNEVDMSAVMNMRKRYKDLFEKTHNTRLGFMSFFTKACVECLKRFPDVNASIDGEDIVYHNYFDIGIAVSTERGLVVPVLRDVDQMSMADVEKQIRDFAARGRDNKLTLDDMTGGNFTITNGGTFGSMLSTPILNPPQSAILGMHNIVERPVAVNGEVVIRPIMYLALSYDHRIVDGKDSVQFLVTIKQLLESPEKFLLDL
jgi:2-oxoglutarate dehydrogenase E2 component (dihydrolipoamide succinyltransferase)